MGFEEYALSQLKLYKANIKSGTGPKSPKEKRMIREERNAQKQAEQERLEKESVTFECFFKDTYHATSQGRQEDRTAKREEGFLQTGSAQS